MKPTFIVLVLLASVARSQTQISCSDYGQAIYCSNGLSAIRAGNTLYFSDGTLAQTFGNTTTIQNQPVQISSSNASTSYAAGQVIGGMVGGIIVEVKQRRKFDRICDVDWYARGWLSGMPAFCSREAVLDACSNIANFDLSGFKFTGDTPHHLSWTSAGTLTYLPNWPRLDGGIECIPDVAKQAVNEARLWLAHKHEVEVWAKDLHPHLSQDDCARIVNYIYAHPDSYDARKVAQQSAAKMFEKIYVAVKATS
jgi:hypothetical protein